MNVLRLFWAAILAVVATPALAHIGTGAHTHAEQSGPSSVETAHLAAVVVVAVAAVGFGVTRLGERLGARARARGRRAGR